MARAKTKMTVVQRPMDSDAEMADPDTRAIEARREARTLRDLTMTIPEQVAKSKVHFRNYEFKEGRKEFHYHRDLRFVEKMFPYALPKPLLVDQPQTPQHLEECQRKAVVLKRLGYRYLIFSPSMTIEEALDFLGEL